MRFLVIDCGTSSCRVVVISGRGKILSRSRLPIRIAHPEPLFAEIDTDHLWTQVQALILSEVEKHPGVRFDAVGVSAMLGYVFLDKTGRPLMPAVIYSDNRAVTESEEIRQLISDEKFYAATGRRISPFLLAPKIRWLAKQRPDVFNRIQTIIGLKDDMVRRLTGQIQTDTTHLDYSGLYNVYQAELDPDLLDILEIDDHLFPPASAPTCIAGTLTTDAGKKLGLFPGTPVVTGSTDGTTAMYGAGVMEKGNAVLVSGTTDVLMLSADRSVDDDTCTLNINSGMSPGTFLIGGPMGSSGGTLNRFEDMLGRSVGQLAEKITALPAGANGLLFFPGLTGERSPYWKEHLTGGMVGLTAAHQKEHLLRAIMEGCAFRIARLLEILAQNGLSPRTLTVVGGGAGNEPWNQIRADVTGLEVINPAETEATCLGTALFCHAALDTRRTLKEISASWRTDSTRYLPRKSRTSAYRELVQLFTTYIETNETLYKRLNDLNRHDEANKKWKDR